MADPDPKLPRPRIVIEGPLAERAQQLVDREEFESLEEVAEAAFEAFEREHARWEEHVRGLIQEAFDDPDPGMPMEEVFALLDQWRAKRRAK